MLLRSPEASWHSDYRDTAYIYIGGLPFELSEGDIITIFSQYGEPTFVELVRDKETGKSKGFAFLKYEDQRSTDLAVDNLGGTTIMNRILRVDHTRYKKKDDGPEDEKGGKGGDYIDMRQVEEPRAQRQQPAAPMLKEERELLALMESHDYDDPMKDFLIQEKKEELAAALAKKDPTRSSRDGHRKHHRARRSRSPSRDHRHHHSRRDEFERDDEPKSKSHSSRHDDRRHDERRERRDDRDRHHSRHER